MTAVQDTTDRRAKWMRRAARILALIWASMWTFNFVATAWVDSVGPSFNEWIGGFSLGGWITIAVLFVIPWAIVAVAWRREAIGGVMLVLAGLLLSPYGWAMVLGSLPGTYMAPGDQLPYLPCMLLSLGPPVPALISGSLFLVASRRVAESGEYAPMPEEFADFERMLGENKEKSGTLTCFDCGHCNPVGQTNCEECGAWVPQTAKARWVYGKDR